jgi:hypothetical protein
MGEWVLIVMGLMQQAPPKISHHIIPPVWFKNQQAENDAAREFKAV